jgi:hypothetical protein
MKHSRFKYVSTLAHAHLLIDGKVFHQTLGYFRDGSVPTLVEKEKWRNLPAG